MAPEDRDSPACPRLLGGGAGWDGLGTPSLTGCPVPVGERRSGALGSPEQSTPPFKHICTHGQGCTRWGCPGAAENEGQLLGLLSSLLACPCAGCIVARGMEQSSSFSSVPRRSSPTLDVLHLSSATSQHLGLWLSPPGSSHLLCTSAQRL